MLYVIYVKNNKLFHSLRHRRIHFPAIAYRFLICLSCRTRACRNCYNFKPRMILKQRDKSLTYHTCST